MSHPVRSTGIEPVRAPLRSTCASRLTKTRGRRSIELYCGSSREGILLLRTPLSWLFPSVARMGWLTAHTPNPPVGQAWCAAYLFRGNGAVFTPGFGRLCSRLRAAGVWAEDLRCVGDQWACRHLIRQRAEGRLCGPVVLIGHSRGGRRALSAASWLEHVGVSVDLLVCVDVAFPPLVPANVRRAIHVYRSRWRVYRPGLLRAISGAATLVENIDLDQPKAPIPGQGLHHLNITASPALQEWIANQVEMLARTGDSVATASGRVSRLVS
jgi:pimeloyl-ACP methyl ester carboxylesterase